jgi:hypothetical protein
MDNLKELAIQLLSNLHEEYKRYERVNKLIKQVEIDFPITIFPINDVLSQRVVDLIDKILGEDIGSYFLYEATNMKDGGSITEKDGAYWPIKTIDDVRAYLRMPPTNSERG